MPKPNYVNGGLKALLKILQDATPENQPTEGVLSAYLKLVQVDKQPPTEALDELRRQVTALRTGQASMPATSAELNRLKRRQLQGSA